MSNEPSLSLTDLHTLPYRLPRRSAQNDAKCQCRERAITGDV